MNLKKASALNSKATTKVTAAISKRLKSSPIKEGLDLSGLTEELVQRKMAVDAEEE